MGEVDLFKNYSYSIGPSAKEKKTLKKNYSDINMYKPMNAIP